MSSYDSQHPNKPGGLPVTDHSGAFQQGRNAPAQLPLIPALFHILLTLADKYRHGYGTMLKIAGRTNQKLLMGPDHALFRSNPAGLPISGG
jgi:hypothetical protein